MIGAALCSAVSGETRMPSNCQPLRLCAAPESRQSSSRFRPGNRFLFVGQVRASALRLDLERDERPRGAAC